MDSSTLENWLWDAACVIRGATDAPQFKEYILPLVFLKRLSDVFDDELARLAGEFGNRALAEQLVRDDRALVRFYLPPDCRWPALRRVRVGLGERLTEVGRTIARENPRLQGTVDLPDFNATTSGQRDVDDDRLAALVESLSQQRLGLDDVEADVLGQAYEYLLRKFAEGSGRSAGEFFTPPEVARLIARVLDPQPGMTAYDPCCGSGGLLLKAHQRLLDTHGVQANGHRQLPPEVAGLRLFGQELTASTFSMARMNVIVHDADNAQITLGNTFANPAFRDETRLQRFDLVVANPMWNQKFRGYDGGSDPYERFKWGEPPWNSSADWGWLQHMRASLADGGRMGVVLDTGAVSRGSGSRGANRERDLRRRFVEEDLIEAVFLLPENLFYNTTAPGIVLVANTRKRHPGEILLVNGTRHFEKGRPKNYLTDTHVAALAECYERWEAVEGLCAVVGREAVEAADFNLSPSRYVAGTAAEEAVPLAEAAAAFWVACDELAEAEAALGETLASLGLER